MAYNIQDLLAEMVKRGASDLHITAGARSLLAAAIFVSIFY